jgi:hypothetical protein
MQSISAVAKFKFPLEGGLNSSPNSGFTASCTWYDSCYKIDLSLQKKDSALFSRNKCKFVLSEKFSFSRLLRHPGCYLATLYSAVFL